MTTPTEPEPPEDPGWPSDESGWPADAGNARIPGTPSPGGRRRGARLQRKEEEGIRPFTRFVTRPQTAHESQVAADGAGSGGEPDGAEPADGAGESRFGKIRRVQENLEYRANRIHDVVTDTFEHSSLRPRSWWGIALTALVVAAGAIGFFAMRSGGDGEASADSPPADAEAPADSNRLDRARKAVAAFLAAADNWREKLPLVIDPERVGPLMKAYYEARGGADPPVSGFTVSDPVQADGRWWYSVAFRGGAGREFRALMVDSPDGARLDWENFVGFGTMSWSEFCRSRPQEMQSMRVLVSRLTGSGSPPPDAAGTVAFSVEHRSGPPALTAYAPGDSEAAGSLRALTREAGWHPVNLRLRFVGPRLTIAGVLPASPLEAGASAPAAVASPSPDSSRAEPAGDP